VTPQELTAPGISAYGALLSTHRCCTQLEAEIAIQNQLCREAWRQKRSLRRAHLDAWPPVWRERLNAWFVEQRELAKRWMFKTRCEKRKALETHDFTTSRPRKYT
jgi:hypothetical protein